MDRASMSYRSVVCIDATQLLRAAAARHRQPGRVGHLPVGQDAVGEPDALLFSRTTWEQRDVGSKLPLRRQTPTTGHKRNGTVVVRLFENRHGHHDGGGRRV